MRPGLRGCKRPETSWRENGGHVACLPAPFAPEHRPKGARGAETVLIAEDDPRMQRVLHRLFADEGYGVSVAGGGRAALESFEASRPVLVVLDPILPEISGRELCRRFKALSAETPVIILSAVADVLEKVLLLELGADDYVTKPFSPRELMARAQASIRRSCKQASVAETFRFGSCMIDLSRMVAMRAGIDVPLTSLEFKALRFLTAHAEHVLTREALLTQAWGYSSYPTTRTVDNLILKLRQKLEQDPANPKHLVTVHGAGYRFTL